jgi:hypothetical protein
MGTPMFGERLQEKIEVQEESNHFSKNESNTVSHEREHPVLGNGKQLNFDQK